MKILVCGDAMLDEYWFGDVARISPEAPVPVVRMLRTEERAGAAANVARNARAMGADVRLLAIVGQDPQGAALERLVQADGISTCLIRDETARTVRKLRVIGKSQQVVRIDYDDAPAQDALSILHQHFLTDMLAADVVVFSDYGKGTLKEVDRLIWAASDAGKTVLVDPKGYDYTRYAYANLVKPNLDEMRELVGGWKDEIELAAKATALLNRANVGALLLTRASEGMTLYHAGGVSAISATAREVYDVSGAGDTAIAALAVAIARGMDLGAAAEAANRAAGLVVGRFGTAVATQAEVFA